jgi:hypothetical protein
MPTTRLSPKRLVTAVDPTAMLDYYESLRGAGRPCWFIRSGIQGPKRTSICATPRAAWREAGKRMHEQFLLGGGN